ncbi:MAG: TIGR00366 family protein [Melioribacteraceae bacterium]|nr:TIGR00366 family protein [Melioribacteraceae bacterium]MCF8356229.1 TIGR00366 family protein [Melioribacteraceae bacterium]MCF8395000.1 TIGR00366 family protein [Melioribacteraceae bacterium]MCF8419720.1 TIGR00366 family protein [Melioribacteraceae bacterium]
MKISKLKAPNTYFIIFSLIVLIAVSTWIIPAGEFDRVEKNGKEVVVNGSYHHVERNPQNIDDVLMSPINGFVDAALIIGFVIIVGGAFGVFQKTEAVDSAIKSVAKAHKNSKLVRSLLIPIFMTFFSLAGAVFGMSEEIIPFILIFVPMALMLGYDSITGIAIPFVGAGVGFAGAFLNPFTIGIAQGIADLQLFSGMEYRIIVWVILTITAIAFVTVYANRIKANPEKSITYEIDKKKRKDLHIDGIEEFEGIDRTHKFVLFVFLLGLLVLVYGVLNFGWFIKEICAVFFFTGLAVGVIGKLSIKEISDSFIDGAKALIGTAIIIALARGILIIATEGRIIDTILYALSAPISELHPVVSSQAMFAVQSIINFFVPSGSGQAALTMPIMAPLGDLVGVSRQTAVLAFQFGDGFSNLIIPTSAVTMGVLTLAEVPWEKWARWMLPLQLLLFILGLLLLIPPYLIGWM